MYKSLLRPLLFLFDPESVHHFTFRFLRLITSLPGIPGLLRRWFTFSDPRLETTFCGLRFANPVGLAAGFDKDAKLIGELALFGFGFIEIGTLTPRPQDGNERPRLFRLPADQAIINRMGFNNEGVLAAVARLKKGGHPVVIGGNIGKNKSTPNEKAFEDYNYCFEALYPWVDYFVVNVSSPNTPNLRDLQDKEPLKKLLTQIHSLSNAKPQAKPVLLKIAPDLSVTQLDDVIEILKETKTDGVIATNTTVSREGLKTDAGEVNRIGQGGLSGAPLATRANDVIAYLRTQMGPQFPIIGVGGIMTVEDALAKIKAGANLIQVYTGFIYEGPGFVARINKSLCEAIR